MNDLDTREWLLTNGLGSFASGTVSDAHTRTYHGWLVAAIDPPSQRTLLLARIDAHLYVAGRGFPLGTNYWGSGTTEPQGYKLLQSFQADPVPTWTWGTDEWQLTRQLLMTHGVLSHESGTGSPQFRHQIYIRYQYEGSQPALLNLRPLTGDRHFHHQQHADPELQISQLIEPHRVSLQATRKQWVGTSWQLSWSKGTYYPDDVWYWNYCYPEETRRGLGDREDLHSPGYLNASLQPGESLTLEARVRLTNPKSPFAPPNNHTFDQALQAEQARLTKIFAPLLLDGFEPAGYGQVQNQAIATAQSLGVDGNGGERHGLEAQQPEQQQSEPLALSSAFSLTSFKKLLYASDQFIAHRTSIAGPTVIAGYHWFSDWGRDTLIALPGLALATKRFELARGVLETFSKYCQGGLIPNTFPDNGAHPSYNSIDAALWWIETLGLYLEATQDWDFLVTQYPTVRRIYKSFATGTSYNIRIDALDGLVTWEAPGFALTWMDAIVEGETATPRQGKAIEINALWYSSLCWAQQWAERLSQTVTGGDEVPNYENHARHFAQQAEQVKVSLQKFWNARQHYFYDLIDPGDLPNPQLRPNAVIALSLSHCGFATDHAQQALQTARDRLLTPYGLRSLDPADPQYMGRYIGDPRHRDYAYHQGTVWSWLIGPFIRAWTRFYPNEPLPWNPRPLLKHFEQDVCLGSISEIFDGDVPHAPQGAIAQAWSVAEVVRHWDDITACANKPTNPSED